MRRRTADTGHTVAVEVRSQAPTHGILAQPSSDYANRRHDNVENETQNDSCVDPTQDMTESHPSFVNPL